MLGKRLVLLRGDRTQEDVAQALGISRGRYAPGRSRPGGVLLAELADYYGVSVDYILGRTDDPNEQSDNHLHDVHNAEIPVLGRVAAGVPLEANQCIIGTVEVSPGMANDNSVFALSIRGDSMSPEIRDGDVVIVRQQAQVENGTIAVVMINGQDATVKRFYVSDQGVRLVPINPAYEPLFFSPEEVAMLPVSVIGRVIELRRGY